MYEDIQGLVNKERLEEYVNVNADAYGGACVQVAINVMRHLDSFDGQFNIGYHPDMSTPHGIICECDDQGGITGFMAGAARNIVACCYKDGWKFWLADVISPYDIGDEGAVRNIDKHVKTVLGIEGVTATEAAVREYVRGLSERFNQRKTVDGKDRQTPQREGMV